MALNEMLRLAKHLNLNTTGIHADNPFSMFAREFSKSPPNGYSLHTEVYIDSLGEENNTITDYLRRIGGLFSEVYKRYDETRTTLAVKKDRFYLIALYGHYASADIYKPYKKADEDAVAVYKTRLSDDERYAVPVLYNMPGVSHTMPHQQEIYNDSTVKVEKGAQNFLYGIAAGGGKTIQYTALATNSVHTGRSKRPLVVMPRPLLKQFQQTVMNQYAKGKLRIFPMYLSVWKRWEELGLTFEDIRTIVESQPKNTFFLTDYNFLKFRPEEISLGIHSFASYPVARWMSEVFDFIVQDESQKGKNAGIDGAAGSAVSRALGALVTYADTNVLASGTMVHNTSLDVLGQVSKTSPVTFSGDISRFLDSSGKLLKTGMLDQFAKKLSERHGYYSTTNKRWAFLLPKVNEIMHPVQMTPNQQRFYDEKLGEIIGKMEASEEYKKAKIADHETNSTSQQEFLLNRELSGFEIFMGAPDETQVSLAGRHPFGAEFSSKRTTTAQDLISPKVAKIDEILKAHFEGGTVDGNEYTKSNAKVIIFAYNIAIPKHVYKHSKYKNVMIHYEAEGEAGYEKIQRFMDDPTIKVLVASEKTLSEGWNLQVASRVISLQPGWTPGDFEQKVSRVLRPDVPDENGKLKYNRASIDLDWIICEPSFEVAKTCRLFAKFLDKAKFDEFDVNPRFKDWIKNNEYNDIELFTMNLESIADFQSFDDMSKYTEMYANLRSFQDREYDIEKRIVWMRTILRKKLASEDTVKKIAAMTPAEQDIALEKILSSDDLRAQAMVRVEHKDIAGTSDQDRADFTRGYLPLVPGTDIIDPYNLGLMPVASVIETQKDDDADIDFLGDDSDDDSEDEIVFNYQVNEGDIVVTEFGLGVAGKQRLARGGEGFSPNIPVYIDGIGKDRINLPATIIFTPAKDSEKKRLRGIYDYLKKNRLPTSTLHITPDAVQVNDITIASDKIAGGKPPVKTPSPVRIRESALDALSKPSPMPDFLAPKTGVKPPVAVVRPALPPVSGKAGPVVVNIKPPIPIKPVIANPAPAAPVPFVKPSVRPPIPVAPAKPVVSIKPPIPAVKPKTADVRNLTRPFEAITLNNQMAVISDANNETFDRKLEQNGFTRLGESVIAQVMNLAGMENIVAYLKNNFFIPEEYIIELDRAVDTLKKSKSSISKLIPSLKRQRDFILLSNRRKIVDSKNEIHPIILVDDTVIYIMIDIERMAAGRKLVSRRPVKMIGVFEKRPALYLKFFPSVAKLIDGLEDLENQGIIISNEKALSKDIGNLG